MYEENEKEVTIDLRYVALKVWKQRNLILSVTVFCAIIGLLLNLFVIPKTYSASAQFNTDGSQKGAYYNASLTSPQVLQRVIKDLKISDTEAELLEKITVVQVNNTNIVQITVKYSNADVACKICDDLLSIAKKEISGVSQTIVSDTYSSGQPVSPNVKRNTISFSLAGFFGSILIVALFEVFNKKIDNTDINDLLGLDVLGVTKNNNTNNSGCKQ